MRIFKEKNQFTLPHNVEALPDLVSDVEVVEKEGDGFVGVDRLPEIVSGVQSYVFEDGSEEENKNFDHNWILIEHGLCFSVMVLHQLKKFH